MQNPDGRICKYIPEKNDSECADDLTLNTISNEMGMSLTIQRSQHEHRHAKPTDRVALVQDQSACGSTESPYGVMK